MEAKDYPEGTVVFDHATNRHFVAFSVLGAEATWHCLSYEDFEATKRILNRYSTLELNGPLQVHGNLFKTVEELDG